jgi:tetratricopeptide (TPR) repeat protein
MKRHTKLMLVLAILALATTSCAKLQARDNLNKGVSAFTEAHYENAINFFKEAVRLDPELTNAEIYLATAYAQMFIPGAQSEENQKYAEMAEKTFQQVLTRDPSNINAVAGLASIYQNTTQFDKSHEYYLKYSQMDPTNPVPFYAVGTVDWIVVSNLQNPRPEEEQAMLIEEGLTYLDKALALNPDYEEAMAYKNLLYRQKARLAVLVSEKKAKPLKAKGERDAILAAAKKEEEAYTAQADEWFNKAMETRKKLQEQKKGAATERP